MYLTFICTGKKLVKMLKSAYNYAKIKLVIPNLPLFSTSFITLKVINLRGFFYVFRLKSVA